MKLDLGSGPEPAEGFEGVDVNPVTTHRLDLCAPSIWPWPDDSIEALRSSHFIEHIPAESRDCWEPTMPVELWGVPSKGLRQVYKDLLLHFFDEAWRVIVPRGTFEVIWPPLQSTFAFQDPTHRRFIPGRLLMYLSREFRENNRLQFNNARCNWVVRDFSATVLRPMAEPDPSDALFTEEGVDPSVLANRLINAQSWHAQALEQAEKDREHHWNEVSEYRAVLVAVKP